MAWRPRWLRLKRPTPPPEPLWHNTLEGLPFLATLDAAERSQLGALAMAFLNHKRFHGAAGLSVTDAMALCVAAQACLPLLRWSGSVSQRLAWYDDFVGIVLYPGEVRAQREQTDAQGVVHQWHEDLLGEAMEAGPVTLAWAEVADAARAAGRGCNLVIHEFAHKLDLRDGASDGCPPLGAGFADCHSARAARAHWQTVMDAGFQDLRERVIRAERFGEPWPWLDAYGASAPDEFFAVTCEAYFTQPARLATEHPEVHAVLRAFFDPHRPLLHQAKALRKA